MDASWNKSLAWVRIDEGGNDDDPDDNGGRTSRGITEREYTAHVALKRHLLEVVGATSVGGKRYDNLPSDVWKAPDWIIDEIYEEHYWLPWSSILPVGIDYLFFNMNVNSGAHEATLLLQRSLHVLADGAIGPVTKLAIAKADPRSLISTFTAASKAFYEELAQEHPHDQKFLKGWLARADRVEERAASLIPKGTADV